MVLTVILFKTGAFGGGGGGLILLFCKIIIKGALNWFEYTNKNLWGGESPTSPTEFFPEFYKKKCKELTHCLKAIFAQY